MNRRYGHYAPSCGRTCRRRAELASPKSAVCALRAASTPSSAARPVHFPSADAEQYADTSALPHGLGQRRGAAARGLRDLCGIRNHKNYRPPYSSTSPIVEPAPRTLRPPRTPKPWPPSPPNCATAPDRGPSPGRHPATHAPVNHSTNSCPAFPNGHADKDVAAAGAGTAHPLPTARSFRRQRARFGGHSLSATAANGPLLDPPATRSRRSPGPGRNWLRDQSGRSATCRHATTPEKLGKPIAAAPGPIISTASRGSGGHGAILTAFILDIGRFAKPANSGTRTLPIE